MNNIKLKNIFQNAKVLELKPVYLGTYLNKKNKNTSYLAKLCNFTFAYSISSKK